MPFPPRRRPRPRQMLARAKRLFDRGRFAEAAPIFDRLAEGAAERGMLNRAGDLYLQSARCHLEMRKVTLAVEQGKQALRLFGRAGLTGKIEKSADPILLGLDPFGYAQGRRQIQAKSGDLAISSEQFWIH